MARNNTGETAGNKAGLGDKSKIRVFYVRELLFKNMTQGIFPTQGSNPGLLHCRQILHDLNHLGSPWILEWIAYPFSRGSFQPRNPTKVSCTAGRFFTRWATRGYNTREFKNMDRDFSGGPVVNNLHANAGDTGLIPDPGTKIPHAKGQLSLCATTLGPCSGACKS